ncbi:hypothetical protein AVEN_35505-1 [Araneus ventricosus]|uniref:Uncharacterized protein n=1 Tax=Araneus ventricosus TaxID=182803 RepID=A0A4Y2USC4_ARAVE|nr:hypothetical protein AVEN_35505-1 [Araneus ventricosus]
MNTLLPDTSSFNFFVFSHFRTYSFSFCVLFKILQRLDNRESASTDAEDVLNEGNTISHSADLQSVETLLDYTGRRGFDCGDIAAVRKICADIRQEMNK